MRLFSDGIWYIHTTDVTKTKNQFPRESTSTRNDKLEQQMPPSPSGDYKMPLVWIDLEMTGMNFNNWYVGGWKDKHWLVD